MSTIPQSSSPSKDDINLALLAHLLGIVTGFVGALILWLVKKDSPFVTHHSLEALNFQITMAIAYVVCWLLMFIVIGILLMPLLFIGNLVFCILAAMAASRGEMYRYPFALRLLK